MKMRSATLLPSYTSIVPGRTEEISGAWPGSTPKLPSAPGITTISTASERRIFSGETSSNFTFSAIRQDLSQATPSRSRDGALTSIKSGSGSFRSELAGLFLGLFDRADHVEGRFRQLVILAVDDALEALDRVFELHEHARRAGEHFGDMERLRQEALDLAGARDDQLVVFRQFVHAQDRDDVLQRLV